MRFHFTPQQQSFRKRVRGILGRLREEHHGSALISPKADLRPLLGRLGELGLLAPHWPVTEGGLGLGMSETGVLIEEMGEAGIPDTLHLLSILVVGSLIQLTGTAEQKSTIGRALGRGEAFAAVLYSEPDAGTDLSGISTEAVEDPSGAGHRINGTKIYNLQTRYADYGLCLARTSAEASAYKGLTLFLLPLDQPGIGIDERPTLLDEQFHLVTLEDALAPRGSAVGEVGEAWALMIAALSYERTGMDYYVRARRWLSAALAVREQAGLAFGSEDIEQIGRFSGDLTAARLLVWNALSQMEERRASDKTTAMAKLHCSELAQRIAWWASDAVSAVPHEDRSDSIMILEAAFREAPGLTISAGASEIMLSAIAQDLLTRGAASCAR